MDTHSWTKKIKVDIFKLVIYLCVKKQRFSLCHLTPNILMENIFLICVIWMDSLAFYTFAHDNIYLALHFNYS